MHGEQQRAPELSLEERVGRLEKWLLLEQRRGDRLRVATAGLAAGVTALFLSWSLPWLRLDQPMRSNTPFEAPDRTTATGWDLMTWAVLSPEGSRGGPITTLAVAPSVLALLVAVCAFVWRRNALTTTAAVLSGLGTVGLLLLNVGWDNSKTTPSTGMVVAMLACLVMTLSAVSLRDRVELTAAR